VTAASTAVTATVDANLVIRLRQASARRRRLDAAASTDPDLHGNGASRRRHSRAML
jgi:hypothetical protein